MSDIVVQPVIEGTAAAPLLSPSAEELLTLTAALDGRIPFGQVSALALTYFDNVVKDILGLEGEYRGNRFVAYNPKRDDCNLGSFGINPETGQFYDFADDDCRGSDLIALAAYVWDCGQTEAGMRLLKALAELGAGEGLACPQPVSHQRVVAPPSTNDGVPIMAPVAAAAPALNPQAFVHQRDKLEALYDYTDEDGRPCFTVLRIRKEDGTKSFMPVSVRSDPAGSICWIAKMPIGLRPLFGLPMLKASSMDTRTFVVEGEKAALALRQMLPHLPVLTSASGAHAASKSNWAPLAGRDIVIWPDNDEAGGKYQQDVIKLIRAADPATPIAIVSVEAVLRAICATKEWVYDDKLRDFQGWDAADLAELGLDAPVIAAAIEQAIEALPQEQRAPATECGANGTAITGVRWNSGKEYRMTRSAVQVRKTTDTKSYWTNICSRLQIVRQLRDGESVGWSLELVIAAPDGTSKTIVLPKSRLTDPQNLRAELLDNGVLIYNWTELQDYLGHAIPAETHTLVRRPGWNGSAYVQVNQTYGQPQEPMALDAAAPACTAFEQQGTLEAWNREVGRLCVGNSRMMLAVCLALAGPLLQPFGVENGGVHLVGPSSIGKTTALYVAASIYGDPLRFILTWRTTSNGLEVVLASRNDCVALIDEMGQATPEAAGDAVYMAGNGQGKTRMTRQGTGARKLEWRLLFMSTGEIPLQQHMEAGKKTTHAGMEVRLLNTPADSGRGYGMFDTLHGHAGSRALADHLREATTRVYGTAGDVWFHYLTNKMAEFGYEAFSEAGRVRLAELEHRFARQGADGQVNRAAKRFALLALAGEMAVEAGIGGWASGDATAAMQTCFDAWIAERGGLGSREETQALRQVQHFFEQHGQSSFQRIEMSPLSTGESVNDYRTISQRAGYYRPVIGNVGDEFYVLPEPFRSRVCAGLDPKLVTRVLRDQGLLLADTSRTIRVPGLPNPIRAYRISGRIVGFDPSDSPASPPH